MKTCFLPLLACLLGAAAAAHAHIVLDQPEAEAGKGYKAVLRVGHGCDGAATKEIVVTLPTGLRDTKPMPKPGWTLTTRRTPLDKPYDSHGKAVTDEVAEIRWTARTEADQLQDAWYDEFALRTVLPAEPGTLWLKVRQVCTTGEWNWAEIPAAGASPATVRAPALRLTVKPAATAPAAHVH